MFAFCPLDTRYYVNSSRVTEQHHLSRLGAGLYLYVGAGGGGELYEAGMPPPEHVATVPAARVLHLKGEIFRPVVEDLPNPMSSLLSGKLAVSDRTAKHHIVTAVISAATAPTTWVGIAAY